jgi:hypothetical protein
MGGATIVIVTTVEVDLCLQHCNNVRILGGLDGTEEDARLSAIIEEDTFLSLNTKVEVMGTAELEEVRGRGPDWVLRVEGWGQSQGQ